MSSSPPYPVRAIDLAIPAGSSDRIVDTGGANALAFGGTVVLNAISGAPVSGNGSYDSESFTALVAGTYQWVANYSGDANNNAAVTACNDPDESVVVGALLGTAQVLPALSTWALALLAGLLALVSFLAVGDRSSR